MISAIGSSSFVSPARSGPSIAALQAQLDSYQKQLSDCVNCATATTPQGKQTIQDISSRISDVQARLTQAAAAKSNTQPIVLDAATIANTASNNDVWTSGIQGSTTTTVASATANLGSLLDVMA